MQIVAKPIRIVVMVTIEIGTSYSRITGLLPKDEKALKEILSYTIGGSAAFFSGYGIRKRSLLGKKGEFATGLRHRVLGFCFDNKIRIHLIDLIKPNLGPKQPIIGGYAWQNIAVEAAVLHGRGIISAPTGSGKSRVIQMISQKFNLRTLVVVPSLEIKRQLSEDLKDLPNVVVENIDSKILTKIKNIDVLIIDEAHHVAAKTYQKLNKTAWVGIHYRFFMTATPFRNDTEETLLFEGIAGKVIYTLTYDEAISLNYIVPIEAYYIECPKQDTNAITYAQVYSELVANNDIRNDKIATLLSSLQSHGLATLCLVREVAHGKILSQLSGVPFVSGEDEESRRYIGAFNAGRIKTLIGTTGILGEGVDTKPAEYIIIAGLGKAKSQFMQQVGRGVRCYPGKESAKIVIIKDKSHKFTLRHFKTQATILKDEYNANPTKLDI